MKKYLIIFTSTAYANSSNLEGLELALGLSAFEQPVGLLFLGDSVLQLIKLADNELVQKKNYTKVFPGLKMFDITDVHAEKSSLEKYKLNVTGIATIETAAIADLIAQYDIVLQV